MANGRNDRDHPRSQGDDRRRPTERSAQNEETGYPRRRFEDCSPGDEAYGNSDDRPGRDSGNHYGGSHRDIEREGGHAFDFARRDSNRSDLGGRTGYRPLEEPGRFSGRDGYGLRADDQFDRGYGDRTGQDPSRGSPRGGWPQRDNWISRYVAADARLGDQRSAGPSGPFRGKGPKGYVRSDERIKEDVSDRLSDEDTLDASDVTVEVLGGEVTLSGYVDSRQAKRMAEDCAEQCAGVGHIQNNLRLRPDAELRQDPVGSTTEQLGNKPKTTND